MLASRSAGRVRHRRPRTRLRERALPGLTGLEHRGLAGARAPRRPGHGGGRARPVRIEGEPAARRRGAGPTADRSTTARCACWPRACATRPAGCATWWARWRTSRTAGPCSSGSPAATHDPLTGLANRAHLVARLDRRLASTFSGRDPLAVLFVDLDGFKRVNDSLGHTAGDQLLVTLADRLRAEAARRRPGQPLRRRRVRGGRRADGRPRRCAGDGPPHDPGHLRPADLGGCRMPRATSASPWRSARRQLETLLRDADAAMYEAKSRGPNGVWLADAAVRSRADRRFGLEGALADAPAATATASTTNPSSAWPRASTWGGRPPALGRRRFGPTPPSEIIPSPRKTGLIHQLTDWSVSRAGRDLRTIRRSAPVDRFFPLGINLSCAQLSSATVVDRFLANVDAVGLDPTDLVVEVTDRSSWRTIRRPSGRSWRWPRPASRSPSTTSAPATRHSTTSPACRSPS